jgi:molybdate transport system substrate-binding protein
VRRHGRLLSLVAGLAVGVVAACSNASGGGPAPARIDLTVYAAASLKGSLEAVETAYATVAPGVTLTVATDASSTLRTQIEQGAPADVFLSADEANPRRLVEAGLADGNAVDFAGTTLVVIVPAANPAGITTPADLARPGIKIIAAGVDVPIAAYTSQAVANLAREPGYPVDFATAFDANVVSREDNVKAVVAKIGLGEGDAAIVYATDAKASRAVRTVDIPVTANVAATYSGVVIKASARRQAAGAFLAWLAGPEGRSVLAPFGFVPPA